MNLLDRLTTTIDKALDEGKLRMDLMRVRRRKDNAARDLGYLVYRQSKGATPAEGEVEGLTRKIAEAEAEVEKLEARIKAVKADGPAPQGAEPPAHPDTTT